MSEARDVPISWKVVASAFGGILMLVIAWEASRAVEALRSIETSLAVAVDKLRDHDRRIENLETLFLKRD